MKIRKNVIIQKKSGHPIYLQTLNVKPRREVSNPVVRKLLCIISLG